MLDRNLLTGLLAALAASFIGSAWQLVSRHGVTTTLGPIDLALLRYGIPALLLMPLWFGRKRIAPKASLPVLAVLVAGGGLPFGLLVLAGAQWAPASHMGIFMAGSLPLFTAIGAWLHKRQRIEGIRLAGLACIAIGMALFAADSFRGGTSSTTQCMPVMARTRSRISSRSRARSALSDVRHWTSTAGVSSPPWVVMAKAAMSPALKPGSCSTAHSMSCGQWFLPLMMIMSLARPTM